ncbi:hypothetical protein GCM10017687_07380 [Streptomyces echinatus]
MRTRAPAGRPGPPSSWVSMPPPAFGERTTAPAWHPTTDTCRLPPDTCRLATGRSEAGRGGHEKPVGRRHAE